MKRCSLTAHACVCVCVWGDGRTHTHTRAHAEPNPDNECWNDFRKPPVSTTCQLTTPSNLQSKQLLWLMKPKIRKLSKNLQNKKIQGNKPVDFFSGIVLLDVFMRWAAILLNVLRWIINENKTVRNISGSLLDSRENKSCTFFVVVFHHLSFVQLT